MHKAGWAVAIQSKALVFELELGTAICSSLRQLDLDAMLVEDGDPAGLRADVLLLVLNLANFPAYCRRLETLHASSRPRVILWQMDPLLPPDMPREAETAGLKAAAWRRRFGLHYATGAMSRWKKLRTGIRLREWANKQCSAPGYRKAARLIRRATGQTDFNWPQVRGVMTNWQAILDAYQSRWVDRFVCSTNQRRRFLDSRGVPAQFVPVGAYDELGRDLGLKRDVAVGFLGDIQHGRRREMLERLEGRLKGAGVALERVVGNCHGERRCQWLNRVRILINLHNLPWNPAWIRFLMAARCGTLVVSEPMNDEHPMTAGEHYVSAAPGEMPETILRLLNDPVAIARMTRAAALLCREELSLLRSVEQVVACARTNATGEPCLA